MKEISKMIKLKTPRQNNPVAVHLKTGMPIRMNDGWRGTVRFVIDGFVHCDELGANPHETGRAVKTSFVTIDGDNKAAADWKLSLLLSKILATASTPTVDREHRMVDFNRERLECEWNSAPD
jgi:hypothetical protein